MKVTKNTAVWDKLTKDLKKLDKTTVKVGWFDEQRYGGDNGNQPMAYIAMLLEQGHINGADAAIPGAYTPPRPFMRVGFKAEIMGSNQNFLKVIKNVEDGSSPFKALSTLSPMLVSKLQKVMIDWNEPGNAALTIKLKGFDDPLRESGKLIKSVTAKVESES